MYVKKHAYVFKNEKAASSGGPCSDDKKRAMQPVRLLAVSVTGRRKERLCHQ